MSSKPTKRPRVIITALPAERVSRLIADAVLNEEAPDYFGPVRCSISRIPEECAPSHWSYGVRLELVDSTKPKAKRGRKPKA